MPEITCVVVTPEETALEQACPFVVVPLYDGELGVAPKHAPLIGRLGFGELRLKRADGGVDRYYVDGGFVQIANNVVSVMTNRAIPAGKLDADDIRQRLASAASMPTDSEERTQARERAIGQARAQLRIAQHQS